MTTVIDGSGDTGEFWWNDDKIVMDSGSGDEVGGSVSCNSI